MSSLHQNKCSERGTLHRQATEALMSEVKRCVTSDINVTGDHKYDHKIHSIVLIIMVILSYKRKMRLDRTHIVFFYHCSIIRRMSSRFFDVGYNLDTKCHVSDEHKWSALFVRFIHILSKFRPTQMFIRQNRPSVLSSSHMFKRLSDVRPIYMQCSDEHTGLLSWCASDKEQGGLVFVPFAQMCPGSTDHNKFGS